VYSFPLDGSIYSRAAELVLEAQAFLLAELVDLFVFPLFAHGFKESAGSKARLESNSSPRETELSYASLEATYSSLFQQFQTV
jgi:hypothetical protein